MYVESFARVRSLSLTGKILRFFVDKFIVQWNENVVRGAHFQGWLI
jgi:beta-1,4-N-acetylglucosaminyltransferase